MKRQQTSQRLSPQPQAPGQARRFVAAACHGWGLDDIVDTVQLLTSELVTNGLLHADSEMVLTVALLNGSLVVEVHDDDPRIPVPRQPRQDLLHDIDVSLRGEPATADPAEPPEVAGSDSITGGRGLLLVDAYADAWGVESLDPGKKVWFRVGS